MEHTTFNQFLNRCTKKELIDYAIKLEEMSKESLEACKGIIEGGNIDYGTYWKVDIADIKKIKHAITKAERKSNFT